MNKHSISDTKDRMRKISLVAAAAALMLASIGVWATSTTQACRHSGRSWN